MIRIAMQKNGRLFDCSLDYLNALGLQFPAMTKQLTCQTIDNRVELLLVRNSDIPIYVSSHVADYGIVGYNVLVEQQLEQEVNLVQQLNFGHCELVIATTQQSSIRQLQDLEHERIATSYPNTLKKYLKQHKINASVIPIQGSVEICPQLGLSDAICDISQTGQSLKNHQLVAIDTILQSSAVLIKNKFSDATL